MATKKISELEAMTKAEEDDVLVIVDTSEGTTKKIRKDDFLKELQEENEKLKEEAERRRNNQLKGQGEGESIYVEDSADDIVNYFNVKGNSKQDGEPNPENKVPMLSAGENGNITDKIVNHNVFDKNNANIINAYINSTTRVINTNSNARTLYIPCKSNTTYTVSRKAGQRFYVGSTEEMPANGVICTTRAYDNTASELTITTGINDKYLVVFYYLSSADTLTEQEILDSIQIEPGTEATPYVDHKEKTYNIPTQQPMRSIGDVRDLFVKENGNWIERHWIGVYEPNNDLAANGMTDERIVFLTPILNIEENLSASALAQKIKCNILQSIIVDNSGLNGTNVDAKIRVVLSKNFATTYDEARAFFATNGLQIIYQRLEPLDLPCTEEQIAVLEEINKAETYKGGTVVMSEDEVPAYVETEYIKDLETVINNLTMRVEVIESEV